jgi:hypothetical protein
MTTKTAGGLLEKFASKGSSLDKLKELKEKGTKFYKVPDGTTNIRILPSIDEENAFYLQTGYYFINGKYVYDRRFIDENERSVIGAYASKLWKRYKETNDERIAEEAKSLFPKEQYLYNVLVRGEDGEKKVQVMQSGKGIKDDLVSICLDDDYGDITNVVEGRDVGIKRKGKGKSTSYQVLPRDQTILVEGENDKQTAKMIEEILEQRKVLSELLKYPTKEEEEEELKTYLETFGNTLEGEVKKSNNEKDDFEDKKSQELKEDEDEDDTMKEIEAQLQASKKKRVNK